MNAGGEVSVKRKRRNQTPHANGVNIANGAATMAKNNHYSEASFMKWTVNDAVHVATHHWMLCLFALGLLFFMAVEYTLRMVPSSSPPFDLGFIATRPLHALLESSPNLNTLFAALNTVRRRFKLSFFRSERIVKLFLDSDLVVGIWEIELFWWKWKWVGVKIWFFF